jgi:hypothetical protein
VTPFDATALLAMLLTFYPIVGPAALARARSERPEYFAAGTIGGKGGDKLLLPDGRVFDLIYGVSGPSDQWRWQVVELGLGIEPPPDPFALEPGPITPIDLSAFLPFDRAPTFAPLVARELAALPALDAGLFVARQAIAAGAAAFRPGDLDADLGEAIDAIPGVHTLLDQAIPADELGQSQNQSTEAGATAPIYDEPLPGEFPGPGDLPPPPPPDVDL